MASFLMWLYIVTFVRLTVIYGYDNVGARDIVIKTRNERALLSNECPAMCVCQNYSNYHLNLHCDIGYSDENLAAYFGANARISQVTFQNSSLTTIPASLCNLPDLSELSLSDNQIASIPNYNSCFQKLSELGLANNMLTRLNRSTFEGFKKLRYVYLEYNKITFVDSMTFLHPGLQLLKINLQNNRLEHADTWMFRLPRFLDGGRVHVNLSCNNIHSLSNTFDFRASDVHRSQSIFLDMRKNQIRSIVTLRSIFRIQKVEDAIGMWGCGFLFQYNPFDCDCDMFMFLNFTRSLLSLFTESFWNSEFITVHCQTPLAAEDKLIYKVPDDVFRCYVNDSCPQGAECIHTPGNTTMTIRNKDSYVTSLPEEVPKETHIQIFYPNTRVHTLSEREYLSNVTTIDLAHTHLSNITDAAVRQLMPQVRHINFRESKLRVLPEAFTSATAPYLHSVDLAGNPFQCDCHMPHMREWLLDNTSVIIDLTLITCSNIPFHGKTITSIHPKYLICGYSYVFGAVSVLFLLILILIFFSIFFALKRRIMMRLVKFFDRNFTLVSSSTARELKYHITIFVADEDQDRADSICEYIESSGFNFKVHRLGYLFGSPKLDITDKLTQSEGCLFFLSSEAVQDYRCIFCFRFAVDEFIRHYHKVFLVPVLLDSKETLIRNSKIPKDTKLFLQLFDSVDMSDGNTENFPQLLDEMTTIMKKQVEGFPHALTTESSIGRVNPLGTDDHDTVAIYSINGAHLQLNIGKATGSNEDNVDTEYITDLPSLENDNCSDTVNI